MDHPKEDNKAIHVPERLVERVEPNSLHDNQSINRPQVAHRPPIAHRPPSNVLQRFYDPQPSTSGSENRQLDNGYLTRVKNEVQENEVGSTSQLKYDKSSESGDSITERNSTRSEVGREMAAVVNIKTEAEEVVDEINPDQIPLPPPRCNETVEQGQEQLVETPKFDLRQKSILNQLKQITNLYFNYKMQLADYAAAETLHNMASGRVIDNSSVATFQSTEQSTQKRSRKMPQKSCVKLQRTDTDSRTIDVTEPGDNDSLNAFPMANSRPLGFPMFSSTSHRLCPIPPLQSHRYETNYEQNPLFPQCQQRHYLIPQQSQNLSIQDLIDNGQQQAQLYSVQRQHRYDISMPTTSTSLNPHELQYPIPRLEFDRSQYESPEFPHIENVSARTPLTYPQLISPSTGYQTIYEPIGTQASQSSRISNYRQLHTAFRSSHYQQIEFELPRVQQTGSHVTTSQQTMPQRPDIQRIGMLQTWPQSQWPQPTWPPIKDNGQTWPQPGDLPSTSLHRAPMKQSNLRKTRKEATVVRRSNTQPSHPQQTGFQTTRHLPTWAQAMGLQQNNLQLTDMQLIRSNREPEPRPERSNPQQYVNVQHQVEFPEVDDDPEPLDLTIHNRYRHPRN